MARFGDQLAFVVPGKEFVLTFRAFRRMNSVPNSVENDGWALNNRLTNQLLFDWLQRRVAGRRPIPVPIGMDDDFYKVRVIEAARGFIVFSLTKLPVRTPELP